MISSNTGTTASLATPSPRSDYTKAAAPVSEVIDKMTFTEHLAMYWKFFFAKAERTPAEPLPQEKVNLSRLFDSEKDGLKASWLGHSSLLMHIDGHSILTDPVFEKRVSIIGPSNFHASLPLAIEDLPAIDVVIISHDHYDHLNKFSIKRLANKAGLFIVPTGVGARLAGWGVAAEKIIELGWWQEYRLNENLTISATPAQHFSGRGLMDRNRTLWASYVISSDNHRVFFSGDSGYFDGFKEIGKKYGPFDVNFLECGAYNERWSKVHMFPEQTVQAHLDLGGNILQPIHYATFNLAMHPWYEPVERLIAAALPKGVRVSTPIAGSTTDYAIAHTLNPWWNQVAQGNKTIQIKNINF